MTRSLLDPFEEKLEQISEKGLHPLLRNLRRSIGDEIERILFVLGELFGDLRLAIQLLDLLDRRRIFLAVVLLEGGEVVGRRAVDELDGEPRALEVLDVRADFPGLFHVPEAVEEVVLDLEVFSEEQAEGLHMGGQLRAVDAGKQKGCCHRQVEGVKRRLVLHNPLISFQGEM